MDGFVPERSVRLWRLPQAGFVLRGGGRTVIVDPWLATADGIERASAAPCRADELPAADLVCCTHEHPDHLDGETLGAIAQRSPGAAFVVPVPLVDLVAAAGVDAARVVGVAVEEPVTAGGVDVLALPARHAFAATDDGYDFWWDGDGRHRAVGYVLRLGGVTVFHAGDTVRFAGDAERLRRERADVALLPVNGRDAAREAQGLVGNLDAAEAASLAVEAGIPHLVPCHHDGVAGNTADAGAVVDHVVANALPLTVHLAGPAGVVVTP
jgi:L-ascorbate metabolism protein UlaG (beta-lactamase superfamily)